MILDNKHQKRIMLQLLNNAQFKGSDVETIMDFKSSILNAEVLEEKETDNVGTLREGEASS